MAFKSSINIKFDLGNAELITRYIPTPSHAEAMKGIINGFTTDTNSAHIIVGPYGTGKSLLANVVGSIVSKMASAYEIDSLAGKFEQVDDQIASKIKDISKLSTTYLPILLSGNEGRFRHSILSGILKKLKEKGIDVVLPGLSTKIIKSVMTWNREFPDTYQKFCVQLEKDGRNSDNWIEEIKNKVK